MTLWTAIFGIVVVSCLAAVLNNYFRSRERGGGKQVQQRLDTLGTRVDELTDRVKTLERIVTDKQQSLRREFENLDR